MRPPLKIAAEVVLGFIAISLGLGIASLLVSHVSWQDIGESLMLLAGKRP